MNRTFKIAKWEIFRHLHNKQFLIGLLLTPIIFAFFAMIPQLISKIDSPKQEMFYVIDEIGEFERLQVFSEGTNYQFNEHTGTTEELDEKVLSGEASGYFFLNDEFQEIGILRIYNKENHLGFAQLQGMVSSLLQEMRIQEAGLEQDFVRYLTAPTNVISVQVGAEASDSQQTNQIIVSAALAGILLFLIFSSGTMLLQSALQEKRDRMVEVILSSVSSDDLMQGKIIGHFFLGVFQLVVWFAIALPAVWFFTDVPIFDLITLADLPVLLFFALLGYLLFAALFVGIGATMEDMQSAGNTQGMVFMLPLLAVVFIGPVISNPNGTVATIGTLFPLTSPSITILRYGLTDIPLWELVTSGVILLVTAYIIAKLGAKLFRVGMLMYGKSASLSEMWKWLRY